MSTDEEKTITPSACSGDGLGLEVPSLDNDNAILAG